MNNSPTETIVFASAKVGVRARARARVCVMDLHSESEREDEKEGVIYRGSILNSFETKFENFTFKYTEFDCDIVIL